MNSYAISFENKKVWNFYKDHPSLDIETMNVLFVDIMESMLKEMDTSLNNNIATKLLNNIKDIQNNLISVTDNLIRFQSEFSVNFSNKFNEFKREYIEDIKLIISNNASEKIGPLIKENNNILIDKTHLLISEIIPKGNETVLQNINSVLKDFHSSIHTDTSRLVSQSITKANLDEFIQTLDGKFSIAIANSQNLFNSVISSTEKRLDNRITEVKFSGEKNINEIKMSNEKNFNEIKMSNEKNFNEIKMSNEKNIHDIRTEQEKSINEIKNTNEKNINEIKHINEKNINEIKYMNDRSVNEIKRLSDTKTGMSNELANNVSDLLKKMENSSHKGKISENLVLNILQAIFPSSHINYVGTQKESGDILLHRNNKPSILIENKNYNKNVVQEEVKKFIRDVEVQNCCGLFLSQNGGIANKENYEINIHNGNVLLYVHDVNNDAEKIKIAIDIIDNFKMKLDQMDLNTGTLNIEKEVLDDINKEYQLFATQKILHAKTIKDFCQKLLKQVDDFKMPALENYLSNRYAFSSSKFICEYCEYVAKNQSALSAHHRSCKTKMQYHSNKLTEHTNNDESNVEENIETTVDTSNIDIISESIDMSVLSNTNINIEKKQRKSRKIN
jgi:hypothetical protein